ncbi:MULTISPECIES: cyanate transporter [unclassified Rhizobium]|jgi:CP family cyanate transporter-like MFS transporter|uniref:cyanate transporter n=1 Tax=unclassified Rhizobium TaxID=2613769 RepID=UPI00068AA163|nr:MULTISPECIES: cyanate transporter [unclassified Rhizobium]MBN8953396.1 cyanate transporter [Rhizobium tropici]OJY74408.1 MAG: MFS transporter [Rhizobium sp. 60-20]RKD68001.1 CP family cyanate transporter-like MFS transporter [Rhizobium sp. WW_1]
MKNAASLSMRPLLLVVAIVGLNLRPFITAVGPLAEDIRTGTGLGLQGMSLLTMVPMILMGVVAFLGPALQSALGARRLILAALAVLGMGSLLRFYSASGWQLVGTAAVIGLGVAIIQAVFPGVIKRIFPTRVAAVMGLYSSMLMGGGALGAKAAPIVAGAIGSWHAGLAWLVLPAAIALLLASIYLPADGGRASGRNVTAHFLRRPRVWLLMACFGLVNGGYSSAVAWLSPYYQAQGWTSAATGNLLAVMAVSQAISALVLPSCIGREGDRRIWLWLTMISQAAGFAGLAFWPQLAPFGWAAMVGAGLGGCFALSLVVALDHLSDAGHAGALSALMQGGGFLIAAVPPWIVAVLHDLTGGFRAGWLLHLASVIIVIALTYRLAPHTYERAFPATEEASPDASSDPRQYGR